MRVVAVSAGLAIACFVAACGGSEAGDGTTGRIAETPPTLQPGQVPSGEPPNAPEQGPPPAWLGTDSGAFWLGFSSFCWTTVCADYIAPTCGASHVPIITLERGETVDLVLEYVPKELSLSYLADSGRPRGERALDPETPSWTADREGAFSVFAQTAQGDASYVGCMRFAD